LDAKVDAAIASVMTTSGGIHRRWPHEVPDGAIDGLQDGELENPPVAVGSMDRAKIQAMLAGERVCDRRGSETPGMTSVSRRDRLGSRG
jgi:hypothetical protein